jgi:cytochrome c nitrite reductase small subunit
MEQPLGPLFVPPYSPDRFWILILIVAVPVMVVALVVMVRGRLPPAFSAMAFLLLPAFAYVLGDIHLLEESKKVTFCGSCHETMSPIVTELHEDTDTLAAIHFQRGRVSHVDACYQCHSGYGIWGGVHAKEAGILHMLHTVTGNYDYPLKPRAPFDINSCRGCHAGTTNFRAVEAHQDPDIQQSLLSGEMSCTGVCHPSAHPEAALNGATAFAEHRG